MSIPTPEHEAISDAATAPLPVVPFPARPADGVRPAGPASSDVPGATVNGDPAPMIAPGPPVTAGNGPGADLSDARLPAGPSPARGGPAADVTMPRHLVGATVDDDPAAHRAVPVSGGPAAGAVVNGDPAPGRPEPGFPGRTARSIRPLLVAAAVGGAVSLSLGVYGRLHEPTGDTVEAFGFPDVLSMKAWFTTGAAVLALFQLASALWLWGRLPGAGRAPAWVAPAHRWSGTVAFLLTLPAAYHCLWSLGFEDTDTRVLAHSILGCAFYGAFTTKMLVLRSETAPRWAVPVMGGALVAILTAIWFTSSLWFFTNVGFPGV